MVMRLSQIVPRPTQILMPPSPLYRQRFNPWRRLSTLILPSHPVLHFCPFLNQRVFCSFLRSWLLVERLGTETLLTPISYAVFCLNKKKNPASPATRCEKR